MADNTHETKIVVTGDASIAVNALKQVGTTANRVFSVVKGAFAFLGRINWIIGGIQTVVEGFKKLTEWMNKASIAAAKIRLDAVFSCKGITELTL